MFVTPIVLVTNAQVHGKKSPRIIHKPNQEDLPPKARLLNYLVNQGIRIPYTVCVEAVDIFSWTHMNDSERCTILFELVYTAISLMEKKLVVSHDEQPLIVCARMTIHREELHPPLLNMLVSHGNLSDNGSQRNLVSKAITDWANQLVHKIDFTDRLPSSITFMIQRMYPFHNEEGGYVGWVWGTDPDGTNHLPVGYIKRNHPSYIPNYIAFEKWVTHEPLAAAEVGKWLKKLEKILAGPCRIRFGVCKGKPCLLSVYRADLPSKIIRELVTKNLRKGGQVSAHSILAIKPSDMYNQPPLSIQESATLTLLASGAPIGNTIISGRLVFSESNIREITAANDPVILVKDKLLPIDIDKLQYTVGAVSRIGGPASHAVVMARGLGVAVLPGLSQLEIQSDPHGLQCGCVAAKEGDWVTIDETSGSLYLGRLHRISEQDNGRNELHHFALENGIVKVFVNADSAIELEIGIRAGAVAVGLCRSEKHIYRPDVCSEFQQYLVSSTLYDDTPIPTSVMIALQRSLEELLYAGKGCWIHYRLLDADIADFISGEKPFLFDKTSPEVLYQNTFGDRGCRWGLRTGFYRRQMETIRYAIDEVSRQNVPVRIAVIVPMVTSTKELALLKKYYEEYFLKFPQQKDVIFHFGCMIETPRAALLSARIAPLVDVMCIGTNDLTQAVWALSRDLGNRVLLYYKSQSILKQDPFLQLDEVGVGKLVAMAIKEAKLSNPTINIVCCGEQTSNPKTIKFLSDSGVDAVSCIPGMIGTAILSACQATVHENSRIQQKDYLFVPDDTYCEALFDHTYQRIISAKTRGDIKLAWSLAESWGQTINKYLGLLPTTNWKFFKRDLVEYYFGKREYRRYGPGWNTDDVLQYALQLSKRGSIIRYSLFPDNIACHALSKTLRYNVRKKDCQKEIDDLDHEIAIEIFPQQSETLLCFRAVFSDWQMHIEVGIGQAMYVFEEERGKHDTVIASVDLKGNWKTLNAHRGIIKDLDLKSKEFFIDCACWLYGRLRYVSTDLGVPWLAIEGYYNAETKDAPFVCDIDLPIDLAFHA